MGILNLIHTSHCCEKFSYVPENNMKELLAKETGRERLIRMYSTDEFGYSPEIYYVLKTGASTVFLAGVYGGIKGMVNEQKEFIRKNVASTYESQHFAKRNLVDKMTLAGLRGGAKYSIQYGAFSTLYLLSTFTIANYRNKVSPWEHGVSAALIGGFSRIHFGFKGMFVAGVLGGVLGLFAGTVITTSMKLAGISMEDFRCWQHEEHYLRKKRNVKDQSDS